MGEVVGLFLVGLLNDYQQRMKADALRRGEQLGFKVEVELADGDPARQAAQIMAAVQARATSGMTGVLVSPVSESTLGPATRAVLAAGMDFVLLNRSAAFLEGMRRDFPSRLAFAVLPDQTEIGRIQGQQAKLLAPPDTQILCITGRPDTWTARRRLAGLAEVIGFSNPLAAVDGNWTTEGAQRAVAGWLEANMLSRPVGVFVAQNDDMALGARQAALECASRWSMPVANVPIIGCDGSHGFGQRLVLATRLAATVIVSSAAGPALECLRAARAGLGRPAPEVLLPVSSFPALDQLTQVAGVG